MHYFFLNQTFVVISKNKKFKETKSQHNFDGQNFVDPILHEFKICTNILFVSYFFFIIQQQFCKKYHFLFFFIRLKNNSLNRLSLYTNFNM